MLSKPEFNKKQIVFAMLSHGDKLSFKNDNIIIKDENGNTKHQSSCYRLFLVLIVGHISITSGLIQRAKKFRFSIILMTHGLRPYATFNNATQGHVMLRQKQYQYDKFDIAQYLVKNKVDNQILTLKRIRNKSNKLKENISLLQDYRLRLDTPVDELQSLLGLEGISSKLYFQSLFDNCQWRGRKPRTKIDPTNTLMDIGYTKLFYLIEALLNIYGFDLYKGFYHQTFYQRKSLVCDLVEPFRPIIDWRIRKAFSLNQIKNEDFTIRHNQYRLDYQNAKPYLQWLIEEIIANREEIFIFIQQFYRAFIQDKAISDYPKWHITH